MEWDDDKPSGGGEAPLSFPFQLIRIDEDNIAVRKGTVNGVVPTISGSPLDDDYTLNTITITANTTLYLKATGSPIDDEIDAVSIETSDPGSDTENQAKQTLGSVTVDGDGIDIVNSNLGGSQNVDSCGAFHSWNRI